MKGRLLILSLLSLAMPVAGEEVVEKPEVRFDGPYVQPLDWDTSGMVAGDLDGDDLQDLALINSSKAAIDLLYQLSADEEDRPDARSIRQNRWDPVLTDARFRRKTVVTGQPAYALGLGDLNHDGRQDLVYTSSRGRLMLMLQGEDGVWTKREIPLSGTLQYGTTLQVTDLDGDGRDDIVVLTEDRLVVLPQTERQDWEERRIYALDAGQPFQLQVLDLNRDKRPDLLYLDGNRSNRLFYRLQNEEGLFLAERQSRLPGDIRGGVLTPLPADEQQSLAFIQDDTGAITTGYVTPSEEWEPEKSETLVVRYATPATNDRLPAQAVGDFNGDGIGDVALADEEGAQIWWFRGQPDGSFAEPVAFPSFGGINQLAVLREEGTERDDLIVLSRDEKTWGISRWQEPGRLGYPDLLPAEDVPVAAVAMENVDGKPHLFLVEAARGSKHRLIELARTEPGGPFQEIREVELEDVKARTTGMLPFDLDQDGMPELLLFSREEPMRVLKRDFEKDGAFVLIDDANAIPPSLVDDLELSAVAPADLDGDQLPELLLAKERLVRAVRLNEAGKLEIVDQFNAPSERAAIAAIVPEEGENAPMLLVDTGRGKLVEVARDEDGVLREAATWEADLPKPEAIVAMPARNGLPARILIFGDNGFVALQPRQPADKFVVTGTHQTDLEGVDYQLLAAGEFLPAEEAQLVAIDASRTRILELLQPEPEGSWTSLLHFRIFEQDPHYRGKTGSNREPHDLLVADVTADGQPDILLLVHDRLLVYPFRSGMTPGNE